MPKMGASSISEDWIVTASGFFAVIDGCSNHSGKTFNSHTPGYIAAKLVAEAIDSFPFDIDAKSAIDMCNQAIFDWYKKNDLVDQMKAHPEMRPSCYVAIYSDYRKEVWVLGDCQALIGEETITTEKNVDKLHSLLRSFLIRSFQMKGFGNEDIFLGDDLTRIISDNQPLFQNTTDDLFGYSAIDGFYLEKNNLKIRKVDENVSEIVLSSDGYPKLFNSLALSEEWLKRVLSSDPLCYKENLSVKGVKPGFVSYDDRSYLRFKK